MAKNLISCSWGDFSTRPLLTTASVENIRVWTCDQAMKVETWCTDHFCQYRDERWTPERSPSTSAASAGNHKQTSSRWRRCRTPCLWGPWEWSQCQRVTRSYDHCVFFTFNNWMISDSICCRNDISNSLKFVSKSLILLQETINLQVLRTKVQHLEFRQYRVTAYPFSCRNLSSSYAFSRSRAFSFAVSVS